LIDGASVISLKFVCKEKKKIKLTIVNVIIKMKIQLPEVVIAGLYKDALVITQTDPEPKASQQFTNKKIKQDESPAPPIKKLFLGDNKKNVAILIKDNSAVHINDEWLTTLSKLLSACKLTLEDVAIVNYANQNEIFSSLKETFQPKVALMFDVTTQDIQLPFTIPHYQVQRYADCIFMTAPSSTLSTETQEPVRSEKKKLWEKLKLIFNV
jgi:hypothetical protein